MTFTRCQERRFTTHDHGIVSVSDAALATMAQGRFPSNHTVGCDCAESNGKIAPQDCQYINVRDGDGNVIARFATKEFGAQRDTAGNIVVFRRPGAPKLTPTQDHARRIHQLNLAHEKFYERGPA